MAQRKWAPLDLPLGLFLLAAGVAMVPAYHRAAGVYPLVTLLVCGGVYWLVSRFGRSAVLSLRIARGMVIACLLLSLLTVTQIGAGGVADKINLISRLAGLIAGVFPDLPFALPFSNSLAAFLEGPLFVAVGLFGVEKQRGWRVIAAISAALIAGALLFTQSRGSWLGVLAAGLVWLALYLRPARWLLWAAGAALFILVLVVVIAGDLLILEKVPVVNRTLAPLFVRPDRLEVYRGSLFLLQDVPFSGIGLGAQFPMNYSRYVLLIQVPFLDYSHNFYLETWLEMGLLGMAALLWLMAALANSAVQLRQGGKDYLTEGAWVGLLAFLLHGVTDARPYNDPWVWLPFFALLGLVAAAWLQGDLARQRRWVAPAAAGLFLLVVVVGTGNPMAAWQANLGSLAQARAELDSTASLSQRQAWAQQASTYFTRSLALAPARHPANLRLGLMRLEQEDFGAAVRLLETAYRASPTHPAARKALGLAYTWAGQVDSAARVLGGVPGIDQELNTWAFWRTTRGQPELARYAWQVSLLLNPAQVQVEEALRSLDLP